MTWTPDWLKKIVKRSELSLNLEYYRNYSNLIDKSYSLWEVGPTLSPAPQQLGRLDRLRLGELHADLDEPVVALQNLDLVVVVGVHFEVASA